MNGRSGSRREFLLGAGGARGTAWLAAHWPAIAAAQAHAHHAATSAPGPDRLEFLRPAEAADVDAIAAQIVPTDDLPGAREAGVVWFLDRSLRMWASPLAARFRERLHAFQSAFAAAHGGRAFAAATDAEQVAHLKSIEREACFGQMRMVTRLGLFSHPSYGGNRGGVGWQLVGFEDRHGFSPAVRLVRPRLSGFRPGAAVVTRCYRDADTVDVVVVGSGVSGGVLARELSRAGFDVGVMEQGPRLSMQDFEHDELKYWLANGITNDPAVSPQSYRKTPDAPAKTLRAGDFPAAWYARLVGGSSVHFTANYRRLHDVDFRERSLLGAIPGADLRDWPLGYDELEPYCTKVEWAVGVSGLAGTHPNEPRRSRPCPMPPRPVKSSDVLLERGARKLGLHAVPAPLAIASQPYRGRATGVHYYDVAKRERFQKGRAVVVAANGAETPRLLLNSANA